MNYPFYAPDASWFPADPPYFLYLIIGVLIWYAWMKITGWR